MTLSNEREFIYTYHEKDLDSKLSLPLTIPLSGQSVDDLAGRLLLTHSLPVYIEQDLHEKLAEFLERETRTHDEMNGEAALERVRSGECSIDSLVAQWTQAFKDEVKIHSEPISSSSEEVFSEVYHPLIHSNALETLLNLEHTYALSVQDVLEQRDLDLNHLEERQAEEMEDALLNVGVKYTDEHINMLAQRSFENTQLIETKWSTELCSLQETQKREYREWVMKVHEDSKDTPSTLGYIQRVRALTNSLPIAEDDMKGSPQMEESFTIHLGAQMKTTHNLRLLCAEPLDLCRHKPNTIGGITLPQPQRLHTAMNLYSNSLCGMILLIDNRLNSYTGIKRDFAKVIEQSSDFHFPSLGNQFDHIQAQVIKANDWRQQQRLARDADDISLKSTNSNTSDSALQERSTRLLNGDVYITKHSNLSEVHVIFHVVTDDGVRSAELTSRDPIVLTLRNVIKICFRYDIYTLTIPLLLTHEMYEDMTIAWCLKRAELILKCVKGFMMEMATWGAQESRTIQFLVPNGMSEDMFSNISSLVTQIFRLSNPVIGKSS